MIRSVPGIWDPGELKQHESGGDVIFSKRGKLFNYTVLALFICRTHGYPVYVEGKVDFCPRILRNGAQYTLNIY
jgi:hypothetical protein